MRCKTIDRLRSWLKCARHSGNNKITYKTIDKEWGRTELVFVRGRVQVKESSLPVTNVVVQLYWVNLEAFQEGEEKEAWHKCLEKTELVTKASATTPNRDGYFSVGLNIGDAIGERATIGLIVWPPDNTEVNSLNPTFILETPRVLGANEVFIVEISEENLGADNGGPTVVTNLPDVDTGRKLTIKGH